MVSKQGFPVFFKGMREHIAYGPRIILLDGWGSIALFVEFSYTKLPSFLFLKKLKVKVIFFVMLILYELPLYAKKKMSVIVQV